MNFETLKRSHLKRNIIIGVVAVLLISAIILNFTRAKYRVTQSIPLANGTINYIPYDFKMVAMYQKEDGGEYIEIEQMPSSGYVINEEKSYCEINGEKDNNVKLSTIDGNHTFANLQKGSKCYLYFDEKTLTVESIIANKTISDERSGTITGVLTDNTTGIVYSVADDWGTSYAYAGVVDDNWVEFAGYWWRIIRINGDESIRMIYQGDSANATGPEAQLSNTSEYNSSHRDNAYVGYMYGSIEASSYSSTHANNNNSTIKDVLDNWYKKNILDKGYDGYVSKEAGFCNDRRIATSSETFWTDDTKRGYGSNTTAYAPFSRYYTTSGSLRTSSQTPTLKCSQSNDLFTTSGSSKGNHKLTYPVGLITADEVVVAGGFAGKPNGSFYLYIGQNYWTMSPALAITASVFYMWPDGQLGTRQVTSDHGIRPVINLKADVTITGSGTTDDPYRVAS